MKKIVAILFVLALSIPAMADTVSLTKATDAASAFFNAGSQTRAGRVTPQLVWMGAEVTRSPYSAPFYVFNNPQGGWIMIAGEDSGHAILGWSDEGRFDPSDLPANAAAWFEEYANQITWARTHFLPQSESSAREWSDLLEGRLRRTPTPVRILDNMATWNQSSPYNQLCPRISDSEVSYSTGTRTYTGCVATATAIVMRHYSHPAQGTGTVGGYAKYISAEDIDPSPAAPSVDLGADVDGYDWASMPLGAPSSDAQKAAVAKLMFQIGLAVEMRFGTGGSSSYQRKIQTALINNFGYDPSMRMVNRKDYDGSAWLGLFKSELDAGRPLIIAGRKSDGTGGHEFVAEGYDSDDNIRINWGWGGSSNGYFALTYFKTTAGDNSGSDYRYSQTLLIGIKPNEGGDASNGLRIYDTGFYLLSEPDFTDPEKDFNVFLSIVNPSGAAAPCSLRVYVANYTGALQEISSVSAWNRADLAPNTYISKNPWACNLRYYTTPVFGDKLIVCYKNTAGDYVRLPGRGETFNDEIPLFDEPVIAVKNNGVYSVGEYFDFHIVNTRTPSSGMTVVWTLDGETVEPDGTTGQTYLKLTAAGDHIVKAVVTIGGETQTLIQEIHVE